MEAHETEREIPVKVKKDSFEIRLLNEFNQPFKGPDAVARIKMAPADSMGRINFEGPVIKATAGD